MQRSSIVLALLGLLAAFLAANGTGSDAEGGDGAASAKLVPGTLEYEKEIHLANVKQLTFGGENAEAYFSADDKHLIFQSTRDSFACDQIFSMDVDGGSLRLISNGKGRTTCAYFIPGTDELIYSSTFLAGPSCPPKPDYSHGYVWPLYRSYDIFKADIGGGRPVRLTRSDGYDAEATVSRDGSTIVFTSSRDGDLELYLMNTDGTDQRRITHDLGYDGGAFFSYDGRKIVYRAYHPRTAGEMERYKNLLAQGLIEPRVLELFTMNADGTGKFQVTRFNAASFCPYYFPDGKKIIFSSNLGDPQGRNFDLYTIDVDGSNLERITYCPSFDGFPMFNSDGTKIVFCSNRNNSKPHETNVFIADWIP